MVLEFPMQGSFDEDKIAKTVQEMVASEVASCREIAERLNDQSLRTRNGLEWNDYRVLAFCHERGIHIMPLRPRFSDEQILEWADSHYERMGEWPIARSGLIPESPDKTWAAIDSALREGWWGLRGGRSLAKLLARERSVRNQTSIPRLTKETILAWADAHFRRTGNWPAQLSGPIPEAPEENWAMIDTALRCGLRGLRGRSSLAQLLEW
jgi:hypothetical protein